jgi:hypothetical protein
MKRNVFRVPEHFTYFLLILTLLYSCTKDRKLSDIPPPTVGEVTVIAHWNFNNVTGQEVLNPSSSVNSSYLKFHGNSAELNFCNGGTVSCYEDVADGSLTNLLDGDVLGNALRLRNPCSHLDIHVGTNGYRELHLSYAVKRTGSGAQSNQILYSSDGVTFSAAGLENTSFTITEEYELITVDFKNIPALNNNPTAVIRILFADGNTNSSGNNRMDNLIISAKPF